MYNKYRFIFLSVLSFVMLISCSKTKESDNRYKGWEVYGGGSESIRYSTLSQIDTANVSKLEVAWTYHTGDADSEKSSQIQHNSIIVNGLLYGVSPTMKLFALEAKNGKEQWRFNPFEDSVDINHGISNNRGVAYWQDTGLVDADEQEPSRILYTAGSHLYAVDALTGDLIPSFGINGKVDLQNGLDERSQDLFVSATSPGIIFKDIIIMGSRVSEGSDGASGDIRAFNVKTGTVEWVFHTIPHPGETGYETWEDPAAWKKTGGVNSWAGMALDKKRGIVYIPLGSASPDFYGGNRKGQNLYANSLVALDASTGELKWHYQTVHHDLWDRDLPSPPSLVKIKREGKIVDAVAQTTKTGFVFVFNRETGEPLFPIEDREVPVETPLEGEEVWPMQPYSSVPRPFIRQHMDTTDINPFASPKDKVEIKERLKSLDSDHMFAPPSLDGMLMYPGYDGGAEWGGSAFDPESSLLYVNANQVPWILQMKPVEENQKSKAAKEFAAGRTAYMTNCVACHGADLAGNGNNPSIQHIDDRYTADELVRLIENGRRMMPGFGHLEPVKVKAVVNFLLKEAYFTIGEKNAITNSGNLEEPYVMTGYKKLRTSDGYPASKPPWGTLSAINLSTGEYAWQVPLGEYPELKRNGIPATGTENYGGPVVTAGGLVFIAATLDAKIRAFNKRTGQIVWEHNLPAAGFATPSIYQIDGRQYVVIACGGGKLGTSSGDEFVAFALPE